jgi:hypothetical protein
MNNRLFQKYKESFDEGITAFLTFLGAYAAEQGVKVVQ